MLLVTGIVLAFLFTLVALPLVLAESPERVVAEARAFGIPGSSSELGRRGDPVRARRFAELGSLMRGISLHQMRFQAQDGPGPNIEAEYRRIPATTIERAVAIAEQLRGPAWAERPADRNGFRENTMLAVVELLCARAAFAPPADADADALLLLDLAAACDPIGSGTVAAYTCALHTIRRRLPALRRGAEIAARLREHAAAMRGDFVHGAEGRFVATADVLRDPHRGFAELGVVLPEIMEYQPALWAICRLGGAEHLRRELAWTRTARDEADPIALVDAFRTRPAPRGFAAQGLQAAFEPHRWSTSPLGWIPNRLHARALAWRLDGLDHPVDDYDPGRGPLRTLARDGRIVAVYSVGWNRRDDGGDRGRDWVWWLEPQPLSPP